MCGENLLSTFLQNDATGSPPHVRGKHLLLANILASLRITPACAGKTDCQGNHGAKGGDHPRMCGEN